MNSLGSYLKVLCSRVYCSWKKATLRGPLITFFFLVLFQVYWTIGSNLIHKIKDNETNIRNLQNDKNQPQTLSDELLMQVSLLVSYHDSLEDWLSPIEPLLTLVSSYESDKPMVVPGCGTALAPVKERQIYTDAQRELCVSDCPPQHTHCPGPPAPQAFTTFSRNQEVRTEEDLITADYVNYALEKYILPFCYGLLGAFIYRLRQLYKDGDSSTAQRMDYRPRLLIGALAGVSIAWLFDPLTAGQWRPLQPFSLAFVAGYSGELLFSALDRATVALSQGLGSNGKPRSARRETQETKSRHDEGGA